MSQPLSTPSLDLPEGTRLKLDAYRKRVWTIKIAEGLFAGVCGLLLSYLLVFVLDRFIDTPAWGRILILLLGAVGLGLWFPLKCHRWVWRTRRFDQLARLLKHRMPRLSDRMLGIIELAENDIEQQRSAALCEAALKQVDRDIRDKDFLGAVPHPRHRVWAWAAGIPLALVLLALVVVPAATTNALARWLFPWQQTERYTFAQLEALPNQMVVPYAEPFSVDATLSSETAWKPDSGTARFAQQPPVGAERINNSYQFDLPPQKENRALTVSVGDARRTIDVEPKTRPELTNLVAQIKLPEYLRYSSDMTKDVRSGSISVVKGSTATFLASASRELAEAAFNGRPQTVHANTITTEATIVNDSTSCEITWRDDFGLTSKQPFELTIQANEDQPPSVTCNELGRRQVILHDEVVTFQVNADDDFGVKQIGIEWQGVEDPLRNPVPDRGESLILGGDPEQREIQTQAAFSAQREGIQPQTLLVRLFAVDYLPNRERVYSPTYTVHVLTPEEHAIWLTTQLRRWSRQAQAVYEREHQLYEINKELRQLPPNELDSPQNRQKIETQAAAEKTNARRLSAVSGAGKQILKEAARNDQFNAATMENLAQMINTLDELAKNRMPSVADLLKQASLAAVSASSDPTDAPPADPSAGPAKPSNPQVGNNRDPQAGKASPSEPGDDEPTEPVPNIVDVESSFNDTDEDDAKDQDEEPAPSTGGAKFGLPTTTVIGGGAPQDEAPEESPAQDKLEEAIVEQEDLLAEFAKVAEELQKILDNLEGSTFVKRLKAASRRQLKIANELNSSLSANFGRRANELAEPAKDESGRVAERELAESDNLFIIQQDLEAYYNRVQQGKYRTVMLEMNELSVPVKLRDVADLVTDNYHGQSIAHAEFWADTFDRWAEQLVGPGSPNGPPAPGSPGGSLSPSIVLEVMKILEKEIGLRDETRGVEQLRDILENEAYTQRANGLAETQLTLATRTADVVQQIQELESTGLQFPQEIALLTRVEEVMREARDLLARPDTGAEPIAAETEAIELLLQAQRVKPPKGGGGGGSTPGGGGTGDTEEAALALIGRGEETNAAPTDRTTSQTTGTTGSGFPAEFRAGLDAYFGELEK